MPRLSDTVTWSGFGFGVAGLLAPRTLRRSYGSAADPEAETMLRMWGARLVQASALGALLDHDDRLRRRGLQVVVTANAVESVAVLAAGIVGSVPARTAVQIAVSNAVVGAVAFVALGG